MTIHRNVNELELNDLGSWPYPIKWASSLFLCLLIMVGGYWFDIQPQLNKLQQAKNQEKQWRKRFELKQRQSANLDQYRLQLAQMRQSFRNMSQPLSHQTGSSNMLDVLSAASRISGVALLLVKPGQTKHHNFYTEYPITIGAAGTYHQLGHFVSQIAVAKPMFTLHDFDIHFLPRNTRKSSAKDKKTRNPEQQLLQLDIMAKTYNYPSNEDAQ